MKPNILIIIPDLRQGGAESSLLHICKLMHSKVNIHILTIKKQGQLVNKFEKITKSINQLTSSPVKFVLYNRYYKKTINVQKINNTVQNLYKNLKFSKIIAFLEGSATYISNSLTFSNAAKIAWIHTSLKDHKKILNYENFSKVITCSNLVALELKSLGVEAQVIYNLIDITKIIKLSQEEVKNNPNEFKIVTVARFDKAKALPRLISASKICTQENYHHHLYIVGYGRMYKNLLKLTKNTNITIINNEKNVYKYMNFANLFVLTSMYEGYGMVIDEALLLKRPVLVTKTNSIEAIGHGKYGHICENSLEGIVKSLKTLINNPNKITLESKNIAAQNLKIEKQIGELFEV